MLAIWLASSSSAVRAQSATVDISVDGTATGTPLERVWPYHGYDEVNYTTTTDGKALLAALAAAHTAPVHVRTHFLLNTGNGTPSLKWGSTNAYTEDAGGNPVYSWTLMDGIMDSITGAGALPFVEIAFMPQALSTRPNPYMDSGVGALDGGCFYPPNDYTKWSNLIKAWVTHESARYPNVDARWLWELWNEPDINYWHSTFAEYAKLYDYTEAAVHQVLPNAQLGGPAVASAGGSFLTQFLQHCATGTNALGGTGARLDLVSFHAKGGTAITGGHVEMNMGNQLSLHQSGMRAVANVTAFKTKPIYITEADPDGCAACPVSSTPADAYRNSPAYGAYEVAMMKRTIELEARLGVKLGGLLTWAFTFPGTPYFAGYRALTTNGINLPVMGAFKLLGALDGTRLPVTSSGALTLDAILANSVRGSQADIDAMATLNGQKVQVLVWNYHDDIVTVAATPVRLTVKVPASFGTRVAVGNLRVDDTHGDAYTVWTSQGSPASPSATQIAALKAAMDPVQLNVDQTVDTTGGSAVVTFDLPRFGISLVTLTPTTVPGDAGTDAPPDGGRDAASQDAASDGPGGDRPADAGMGAGGAAGGAGRGGAGGASGAAGGAGTGASGGTGGGSAGSTGSGGAGTGAAGSGAAGSGSAGTTAPSGSGGAAGASAGGGASGGNASAGSGGGGGGSKSGGCGCAFDPGTAPPPIALFAFGALAFGAIRSRRRR